MAITQAELQELLGTYTTPRDQRTKRKQDVEQAAVRSAPVEDVFASAAKSIIGDDGVNFLSSNFGRGGRFDITQTIAGKGLLSGVAGIGSLGVELPRLAEMGYEYATGEQVDLPEIGYSYDELATRLDAKLPEDATEAEKLLYYGMEALPMLGGGGLLRTGARTAQGALAGRLGEENALLGMAVGVAPEVPKVPSIPGAKRGAGASTRVDAIDSDARKLGRQMANEFGIQETRGQSLYRAAMNETNPELRIKKLAEAERVLALEEAGRQYDPTMDVKGVRTNTALWKENDIKQAQQIEEAMRKIAGVSDSVASPATVKDKIVKAYQGWAKGRMEAFRKANAEDFGKLDRGIKFDLENVVDEIDALIGEFDLTQRLQDSPRNTLLKIRNKILTEKGQMRELSAPELQSILQDLGTIAWKGTIQGLDDLNPGVAKTVARKMIGIFGDSLDNIAKGSDALSAEQAQLLKVARNNFKARVTALQDESSGTLLEFFTLEPEYATPNELLNKFDAVKDDPRQVRIMSSILQQENPGLWEEVKTTLFNREIAKLQDKQGNLDITKLRQAATKLQENELLFGDTSASQGLNQFGKFLDSLEGIFQRIDPVDVAEMSSGNLYRKAKLGSEIAGSLGGPKGRYVSEAATKLMLMIQGGKLPPEAAAHVAMNPKAQNVLIKALKGKANALTPKEMATLRTMVTLGRIQTFATLPAVYFARDEEGSTEKGMDFVRGMFSDAIEAFTE
jgi:hypothetical protein